MLSTSNQIELYVETGKKKPYKLPVDSNKFTCMVHTLSNRNCNRNRHFEMSTALTKAKSRESAYSQAFNQNKTKSTGIGKDLPRHRDQLSHGTISNQVLYRNQADVTRSKFRQNT